VLYYTSQTFTATSGQTVFSVTRGSGYIVDQCFVLVNGLLLDPTEYVDGATTVTLSTGLTAGDIVTVNSFKSSNQNTGVYATFSRNDVTLTAQSEYTASGFTLTSGYELLFLNGSALNENDYDLIGQTITNLPAPATGTLTIIQWTPDNLGTPTGNCVNVVINTIIGEDEYAFSYDANAFNLYENGVLLLQGTDYTTGLGSYTLATVPATIDNILLQQTFARTGAV
jgi:hypothetical protein